MTLNVFPGRLNRRATLISKTWTTTPSSTFETQSERTPDYGKLRQRTSTAKTKKRSKSQCSVSKYLVYDHEFQYLSRTQKARLERNTDKSESKNERGYIFWLYL